MRAARDLTDADLLRLARLGGSVERIAEAAGIHPAEARRRLAAASPPVPVPAPVPA